MNYSAETCDQLIEVLKYIPRDMYKKIPREVIAGLYRGCNSETSFIYNQALPLKKQGLSHILRKKTTEKFGIHLPSP